MPQVETDITPEREAQIMERVAAFQNCAATGNADFLERAERNQRYTYSDQWDPTIKNANEQRKKFSLTVPLIRPQVNQVVGYYLQNPKEPEIRNYRGGERVLANLLTALVSHATKDEAVQFELAQTVSETAMCGSSYMGAFLTYENDPKWGDLEIRQLSTFDCLPDPACKVYDMNSRKDGASFFIWRPWIHREWIVHHWPERALRAGLSLDQAGRAVGRGGGGVWGWLSGQANNIIYATTGKRMSSVGTAYGMASEAEVYSRFKERLDHTWWIEYKPIYYWYDLRQEKPDPFVIVTEEEKQQAEAATNQYPNVFEIKETLAPVMNHTISLGNTLLENRFDELNLLESGQTLFPVVRFNCHFSNGYASGIPEDCIGSQDWVNIMRSTVANIIKKMPNHGYYIGKDVQGDFARWLEENGGLDGIVIDKSRGDGVVEPIIQTNLSNAGVAAQMTEVGKSEIAQSSGIRTEQPTNAGKEGWQTVGLKQQAALTGASPVLNNIDYSLHLLYGLIATVIRSTGVYSDWEISQIIDEKDLIDPDLLEQSRMAAFEAIREPFQAMLSQMGINVQLQYPFPPFDASMVMMTQLSVRDPKRFEEFQRQLKQYEQIRQMATVKLDSVAKPMAIRLLIAALRNARHGRYEATVSTSPSAPTFRAMQFGQMAEMFQMGAKLGYRLPFKRLLEASDMPNKEQMIEDVEEQERQAAMVGAGSGSK